MAEQEVDSTQASQPHPVILTFPYPTPSDVKIQMERAHNGLTHKTEIHAHADVLTANEWFDNCLKKNAFKEGEERLIRLSKFQPKLVHLFIKYMYTSSVDDSAVLAVAGTDHTTSISLDATKAQADYQMRRLVLLAYATLWEIGDFFLYPAFCAYVRAKFAEQARKLDGDNFALWITWYHLTKEEQWQNGFDAVIAEAALGHRQFMLGRALPKSIMNHPELGASMYFEHVRGVESEGPEAMVRFFREEKRKRAGVFARYANELR